jgi:cytochrome c peroxidase
MTRERRPVWRLAIAASLAIGLTAEAQDETGPRAFAPRSQEAGPLADLMGRAVTLASLPAAAGADVWVVRIQAAWCGTCQWQAEWTPTLAMRYRDRVSVIDLLIGDEDNQPADAAAGERWRSRTRGAALTLLAEPSAFAAAFPVPAPLPRVVVIDRRTGSVAATFANPDPDRLIAAIDQALGGTAVPRARAPRVDGLFTADQWAIIQGMRLPAATRPDPTNRVADNPLAADLGFALFFDKGLSEAGIACASCHNADHLFADHQDRPSYGTGNARRNVPPLVLLDLARSQFWDGRADSVWSQAVVPIEDSDEMGSDRLYVAHRLLARYRTDYEGVFGPLPPLEDRERFPLHARPGTDTWAGMQPDDRHAISRVFANVGKALAAFERQIRVAPTALDRYAAGDLKALSAAEKDGLAAFLDAGCAQCHFGPRLSNDAFHNLRFPTARADGQPDRGRAEAADLLASEFSRHGLFSDAPTTPPPAPRVDRAEGAFRTPGLRGVATTFPYGHGGGFDDLRAVIEAHRTGGLPAESPATLGEAEPWAQGFDPALTRRIVRFLNGLRADIVR